MDINNFVPGTAKLLKSNNTIINVSDSFNEDGSLNVRLVGFTLVESKTDADLVNGMLTFQDQIKAIGIYNRDNNLNGVFIVNGIAVHAPPREGYRAIIGGTPSRTVLVSGTTNFICNSYI